MVSSQVSQGAKIFIYQVPEPSQFGLAEIDIANQIAPLEEKPKNPRVTTR